MWTIRLAPRAEKILAKLDKTTAKHIRVGLGELADLDDPTSRCKALNGPLVGLWRLRVGDWRIVCDIRRNELVIIALDLGHRSTIYR